MKKKVVIFTAAALFCALGTYFVFLESNWMIRLFGRFSIVAYFVFPLCALALIVFTVLRLFHEKKLSYVVPVAAAMIGCLLAFVLVNDGYMSKISSNYLRHEQAFLHEVARLNDAAEGDYAVEDGSLWFVLPVGRVMCRRIGNGKNAYCFLTVDTVDRLEGYAYVPYGAPEEWDRNGAWSEEALDMNGDWFYMSLPKE